MILVDSSAWIMLTRREIFFDRVRDEVVALCPPVLQEILQGAINAQQYAKIRRKLRPEVMLDDPMPLVRFEQAAQIYLTCREAGFTIRNGIDCLVAACAMAYDLPLLHDDRDYDHIAAVAPLKAIRA